MEIVKYKNLNTKDAATTFKFILILLCFGSLIVGYLIFEEEFYIAKEFKETTGTVLKSSVKVTKEHSTRSGVIEYYEPQVMYKYKIGNKDFINSTYSEPAYSASGQSEADEIISKYDPGNQCVVYYDPKNPSRAVLYKRNPYPILCIFLAIALITLVICLFSKGLKNYFEKLSNRLIKKN